MFTFNIIKVPSLHAEMLGRCFIINFHRVLFPENCSHHIRIKFQVKLPVVIYVAHDVPNLIVKDHIIL